MEYVKVTFSREEALACIVELEHRKPYHWKDLALGKLLKAMGMKPVHSS